MKEPKIIVFPLIGFAESAIYLLWAIKLLVIIGEGWKSLTIEILFILVDASTLCNSILGWTTIDHNRMYLHSAS